MRSSSPQLKSDMDLEMAVEIRPSRDDRKLAIDTTTVAYLNGTCAIAPQYMLWYIPTTLTLVYHSG